MSEWTARTPGPVTGLAYSMKRGWESGSTLRKPRELLLGSPTELQYTPLPGPTWIRLLSIEPDSVGAVLRCSLRLVNLDQSPEFTALSYTWTKDLEWGHGVRSVAKDALRKYMNGQRINFSLMDHTPKQDTKTIVCNGEPIKILVNLYDALLQLRRREPAEYWIDAICVDQRNVEERTAQVQLMQRIYSSAKLVIVWLGTTFMDDIRSLEHVAALGIDLSRIQIQGQDKDKVIVPLDSGVDAKDVYCAYLASYSVISCQWFRRVWVVQELCLAQNILYMIGDHEISINALLTALRLFPQAGHLFGEKGFDVIFSERVGKLWGSHLYNGTLDILEKDESLADILASTCSRSSRTIHAPELLQARDFFQQGGKWTLCDWLVACRGRTAGDPRDMVFGGLSLIDQDSLRINQALQQAEIPPFEAITGNPFPLRSLYPQVIPTRGLKARTRSRPSSAQVSTSRKPVLTPVGLWPSLKADYNVQEAEVLVNAAACLLSQTGTAEILSLASRVRQAVRYIITWVSSLPERSSTADQLPSWVPTLGSWPTRAHRSMVFGAGRRYHASGDSVNNPWISADGTMLVLDAQKVGIIAAVFDDVESINTMKRDNLISLLSAILNLPQTYHDGKTSFEVLGSILLGPPQDGDWHLYSREPGHFLLTALFTRAVVHLLTSYRTLFTPLRRKRSRLTTDAFIRWRQRRFKVMERKIQSLTSLIDTAMRRFGHPAWKEMGFAPHDKQLRIQALKEFQDQADGKTWSKAVLDKRSIATRGTIAFETKSQKKQARSSSSKDDDSSDPLTSYYEIVSSNMAWRKIFTTETKLLGIGPEWLSERDAVMLVHGAPVPFIFTLARQELRQQEQALRGQLDENDKDHYKLLQKQNMAIDANPLNPKLHLKRRRWAGKLERLDQERLELESRLEAVSPKLANVLQENPDARLLVGEAYVEGIMYGEAMDRYPTTSIQII